MWYSPNPYQWSFTWVLRMYPWSSCCQPLHSICCIWRQKAHGMEKNLFSVWNHFESDLLHNISRELRSCGGAVPYFEARPRLHDFYLRFPFPPLNFIVLVLDVVFCRSIFSSGEPGPGLWRPRLRLQILSRILIQLDTCLLYTSPSPRD